MQPLLRWNSNKYYIFWVSVCSLSSPARKRMPHTVVHSYQALRYYSTLSQKRLDFRKKIVSIKCTFSVSLQLLSETFHILRRSERYIIINVLTSSCKVPVILVRFIETKFSLRIFIKKYSNIQFLDKPFNGSRAVPCGRTDGQTWRSYESLFASLRTCLKTAKELQQIRIISCKKKITTGKPVAAYKHNSWRTRRLH